MEQGGPLRAESKARPSTTGPKFDLDGFTQMSGFNAVGCIQVCDRARYFQNAVVGTPESPSWVMAISNNFSPSAVMTQNLRIMLDDIWA